jgi:hypothetical protein
MVIVRNMAVIMKKSGVGIIVPGSGYTTQRGGNKSERASSRLIPGAQNI